jgi:chromosome partitioning protein
MPDAATVSVPVPAAARAVRTIALMNQKGGVGKTTTTVNLAAGIARLGRSVLVVDLDPQAHATLHLTPSDSATNGGPFASVYDLLLDPGADLEPALRVVRPNLTLLPAETDLAAAESELASIPAADRSTRLRQVLDRLNGRFEFVLMDCPPSLGILTLNALAAAREVFIPMQAHFLALQGVSKLLETVGHMTKGINPRLRVTGIVLCMHDTVAAHSKEVVGDLTEFFEAARSAAADVPWKPARVLSPAIRRNIKLAECPSFGQTIFDYAPGCPGAQDYQALAERVVAEWDALLARKGETPAAGLTPIVKVAGAAPAVRAGEAPRTTQ